MPLSTCTTLEDLVDDSSCPKEVTELLKYITVFAYSLCYPHVVAFRRIIMLSSVFYVFGSERPPSAVPSLLKQPRFWYLLMERFLVSRSSLSSDAIHANFEGCSCCRCCTCCSTKEISFWEPYIICSLILKRVFLRWNFLNFVRYGIPPPPPPPFSRKASKPGNPFPFPAPERGHRVARRN